MRGLSIFLLLFLGLFLGNNVPTYGDATQVALGKSRNFAAVGFVYAAENRNSHNGSDGTATYIGNNLIASAAHVFLDILPPAEDYRGVYGPVVIDVRDKDVYWSNFSDSGAYISESQKYRVDEIIIDADYLRNSNRKTNMLDEKETQFDIAILKLRRTPPVQPIGFIDNLQSIPDIGVLVGYGEADGGKKHAIVLPVEYDSQEQIIFAESDRQNFAAYIDQNPHRKQQLARILDKHTLSRESYAISKASSGDSGGPLLVWTNNGLKIIGILSGTEERKSNRNIRVREQKTGYQTVSSTSEEEWWSDSESDDGYGSEEDNSSSFSESLSPGDNLFFPIIRVQGSQVQKNPKVNSLLNTAGASLTPLHPPVGIVQPPMTSVRAETLPADFDPKEYLRLNQDVRDAHSGDIKAKFPNIYDWARHHYKNQGRKVGRPYKDTLRPIQEPSGLRSCGGTLPGDFNPDRYLELNRDVKDAYSGGIKAKYLTEADWAKYHYNNHGCKKGRRYK